MITLTIWFNQKLRLMTKDLEHNAKTFNDKIKTTMTLSYLNGFIMLTWFVLIATLCCLIDLLSDKVYISILLFVAIIWFIKSNFYKCIIKGNENQTK